MTPRQQKRCEWATGGNELMLEYHDREWGRPIRDDNLLFEFLILEGAQAGLSWATVLNKRAHYRKVFAGFDPTRVARFSRRKIETLLTDAGIIRNRLKVESTVSNAKAFLKVQREFGSFAEHLWGFVDGRPKINKHKKLGDIPATSAESERLSKDLKQRGFRFVGSTICYAYMQAVGLVNDHTTDCFCYRELR